MDGIATSAAVANNGSTPTTLSNGHGFGLGSSTAATDGAEYAAVGVGYFKPLWAGSNLDRQEFVRLTLQAFQEMGYRCALILRACVFLPNEPAGLGWA